MQNILLTGRPGIGKTTIIRKVVETIGSEKFGGFYTEEIREPGRRVGFGIRTIDGKTGVLSHVNIKSPYKVGKYFVNLGDLDEIAVTSILSSIEDKIIMIDEIGKMELFSEKFRDAVLKALDASRVLGTIHRHSHPFTDEIKEREDVKLINVTLENRNSLPDFLIMKY